MSKVKSHFKKDMKKVVNYTASESEPSFAAKMYKALKDPSSISMSQSNNQSVAKADPSKPKRLGDHLRLGF